MRYSRLLAPCLLCVAFMLTKTAHTAVSETTAGSRLAVAAVTRIQLQELEVHNLFNNNKNSHHHQQQQQTISRSSRSSRSSSSSSSNSNSNSQNRTECLALTESRATRICRGQMDWNGVCLANCGRRLASTLPSRPIKEGACLEELRRLISLDQQTAVLAKNHAEVLLRFDCPQPYSVKFQCTQCQEAYLSWICSANIKFWQGERIIKPCRSFCHSVEQKCPFFLPLDKGPAHYAGEPTFLCLDPNIQETGEQMEKSSYGTYNCCYEECNQGDICIRGACNEEDISTISTTTTTTTTISKSSSTCLSKTMFTSSIFTLSLTSLIIYRTRLII
ncbi:calcium-permeable channel component Mid1 [Rhodnius prolixus]|uniref:calcium-permeable channel component Mid1 n=1 Tax=Rhodnius prolixus TaxID=13249 RepID=UPI003D18A1C8